MGISIHVAETIVREHAFRPIVGKVVLLGQQTMFFTPMDAIALLDKCGVQPSVKDVSQLLIDESTLGASGGKKGFIKDTEFFRLLGAEDVVALDHSDYEGAEIIWNLNEPIPDHLAGVADFILDGSTIDNVFDPACTLRNINRLLKPGGRAISTNMGSNHYAPYTLPTPQWIFDYFVYNNFSDVRVYYFVYGKENLNIFTLDLDLQNRNTPSTETLHSPYVVGIVFLAEKKNNSTWEKNPSQSHYRPENEWIDFEALLEPIRLSKRPLHIRSFGSMDPMISCPRGFKFIPSDALVDETVENISNDGQKASLADFGGRDIQAELVRRYANRMRRLFGS